MKSASTLAFLIAVLWLLSACSESNLDVAPNDLTEESFFQDNQQVDLAVIGIYAKMTDYYWYRGGNFIHGLRHLPGDDITTIGDYPFETFAPLQPGDGEVNYFYEASYELINRANTVLQALEEAEEDVYEDLALRNAHQGEALFLRGFVNFLLWNFFGTAPLVTERVQGNDDLNAANSQGNELLDQAIDDFAEAALRLPSAWEAVNLGRATSRSAYGLLGKALMFRATVTNSAEDYTAAINAIDQITERTLVANFRDNFSPETENNEESLFEFQAGQSPQTDNVWLANDFDAAVGSMSAYWGFYSDGFHLFGKQLFVPTPKLMAAFESGDPRVASTLNPSDTTITKYVFNNVTSNSGVGSLNNPRILRYADVLLLKAEALVASGGSTTEAIALVNQLRERARNSADSATAAVPADYDPNETDRERVMEWVRNERFLELAGEEAHRWFDLRRWHLGGHIDLADWDFSSARSDFNFEVDKHLYYPIPTSEVDLNPNVQQNDGY